MKIFERKSHTAGFERAVVAPRQNESHGWWHLSQICYHFLLITERKKEKMERLTVASLKKTPLPKLNTLWRFLKKTMNLIFSLSFLYFVQDRLIRVPCWGNRRCLSTSQWDCKTLLPAVLIISAWVRMRRPRPASTALSAERRHLASTLAPSPAKPARASFGGAYEGTASTRAEAPGIAPSTSPRETSASSVGFRNVFVSAWEKNVSEDFKNSCVFWGCSLRAIERACFRKIWTFFYCFGGVRGW